MLLNALILGACFSVYLFEATMFGHIFLCFSLIIVYY